MHTLRTTCLAAVAVATLSAAPEAGAKDKVQEVTGSVSARIANTAVDPVPTEDAFVREPFALSERLSFAFDQTQIIENFEAPADARLVIESVSAVSAQVGIPEREELTEIRLVFRTNGEVVGYPIPVFPSPGFKFSAHANVRLYVDPGSSLQAVVVRRGAGINPLAVEFAMSGYLIDPESPSLAP